MFRSTPILVSCVALFAVSACSSSTPPAAVSTQDGGDAATGSLPPILDGGGGIPDAPNGVNLCPTGTCNYQSQHGCEVEAGPALACQPIPSPEAGILPQCSASGSKAAGDQCTSWSDCQPGFLCAAGTCKRLCCGGDYTVCPNGEHCFSPLLVQVGDAGIPSGVMVCMPVGYCDVLTGKTCPAGQSCQLVDSTGAVACLTQGKGTVGQACPCSAGFTCVADECRRLCLAVQGGGEPSCPIEEGRCVHYDRDPPNVGECVPLGPN